MTDRGRLALLIAAHVLIGLMYLWATPVFEAPDEGYHTAVIRWIAQGRGLPVQQVDAEQDYAQEGSQPPLYYLLGAGLTAWVDTADWDQVYVKNPRSRIGIPGTTHNVNDYRQPVEPPPLTGTRLKVYALRVFSLALSAATLALAYVLVRRVVPADRQPLVWLTLALVAFNPMMLFIGASVNNDNLLRLTSTGGLILILDAARAERLGVRQLSGLGVVLGLAALSKISGLMLWPVAALALVWARWRGHRGGGPPKKTAARSCLLPIAFDLLTTFLFAALVCGWWYLRNWLLYGDPLGLNAMIAIAGPRVISLGELITSEWYGFYLSFWAIFGAFTILPSLWVQWFFHALSVWALAGLAVVAWRSRRRLTFDCLLLSVFCLLTLLGVIRWTMQTPASQGRLMFGAIVPLSLGLAAGLLALAPERWGRGVAWSLGGLLAGVAAIIPVADIAPQYTPPPVLSEADLPAELRPVHARIGDGIELVGYTADDTPRQPGEVQAVTLYWRALAPMDQDYILALVLLGRGAQGAGQIDTWPGGGRLPTSQWRPGAFYADPYDLPIDETATTPTRLRLSVSAWVGAPDQRLPVRLPDGSQSLAAVFPVGRAAETQPAAPQPAVRDGSTFEGGLRLLGYDAHWDGRALNVTFYWQTAQAVPADYTLFLHVLNTAGEQVGQADGPPLDGDWPTSAWLPGQAVADTRVVTLPADLAGEGCVLRLGWYDPATGARLAAFQPDGTPWPEAAVILERGLTP